MITPEEIGTLALKWWRPFLQSQISGQSFFPKTIDRIGRIKSSQVLTDLNKVQDELAQLYDNSKLKLGYGYVVKTAEKSFRRTGSHELPELIKFDSAEDYTRYIGKTKEWQYFLKNYKVVLETIPRLKDWCILYPEELTVAKRDWTDILAVCLYFMSNPKPNLYIRQLPIAVHTKVIEENESVLKLLLDFLIPDHIRDINQKSLPERYYLKYDEPLRIRLRFLGGQLKDYNLKDIQFTVSALNEILIDCKSVILTENKMNFLTLPDLPASVAIWSGGGFNISFLKGIKWLEDKNIYYWGDLDIQGFHILHQMRSYYPQTISLMMDQQTLDRFKDDIRSGVPGNMMNLDSLSVEERRIFEYLKAQNLRLEQEKISYQYSNLVLNQALLP